MKFKVEEKPYKGRRSIKIQIQTRDWKAPTIEEALCLIQLYCVAEEYRYPQEEGFDGKRRFLSAINDIGNGETLESVLKKHGVHNTKRRVDLLFDDERSLEIYRKISNEIQLHSQTTLGFVQDDEHDE